MAKNSWSYTNVLSRRKEWHVSDHWRDFVSMEVARRHNWKRRNLSSGLECSVLWTNTHWVCSSPHHSKRSCISCVSL